MARLPVICLFVLVLVIIDRSQSASMGDRNDDATEEQVDGAGQQPFVVLPGASNLQSESEEKRDFQSILAKIGLIKRNLHGDSSMKHQYQRRSDDDNDAERLSRDRLLS